jgi:hypothetical protein
VPTLPASLAPLTPKGLVLGRDRVFSHFERADFVGAGQAKIHQRMDEELAMPAPLSRPRLLLRQDDRKIASIESHTA